MQIQHDYERDAIRKDQAIQKYMVLAYKNVKYHVYSVIANFMQKLRAHPIFMQNSLGTHPQSF